MKKLTFIGSVVLSVICLIFTYSYAETYHKASKQYEMCSLNLFVKNSYNVVHATYILSSKKFDLNTRLLIVEPFVYVIY